MVREENGKIILHNEVAVEPLDRPFCLKCDII